MYAHSPSLLFHSFHHFDNSFSYCVLPSFILCPHPAGKISQKIMVPFRDAFANWRLGDFWISICPFQKFIIAQFYLFIFYIKINKIHFKISFFFFKWIFFFFQKFLAQNHISKVILLKILTVKLHLQKSQSFISSDQTHDHTVKF